LLLFYSLFNELKNFCNTTLCRAYIPIQPSSKRKTPKKIMRWTSIMTRVARYAGLSAGWKMYPRAISPPPQRRDIPLKRYNVVEDIFPVLHSKLVEVVLSRHLLAQRESIERAGTLSQCSRRV
jgi:hypothetical protein